MRSRRSSTSLICAGIGERRLEHRVDFALAEPSQARRQMDREEVFSKFDHCVGFGTGFPPEKRRQIFSEILNLEKRAGVHNLVALLS
jgi:hypothetical protein